jgi:hypothetical protein
MLLPSGAYDAGTFHAILGVRARVAHFFLLLKRLISSLKLLRPPNRSPG